MNGGPWKWTLFCWSYYAHNITSNHTATDTTCSHTHEPNAQQPSGIVDLTRSKVKGICFHRTFLHLIELVRTGQALSNGVFLTEKTNAVSEPTLLTGDFLLSPLNCWQS